MRCIFCLLEKPPSIEHVIPQSIGGTATTERVCKECNSFLGSRIDAPLIDFLPIQHRRAELGLASYSGKVPNQLAMLVGGAQEMIGVDGEVRRVQARIDPVTGMIDHRILHHSKDIELPDGKKAKQISVDARDKDEIPKIITRERKRHGLPPLTDEQMAAELAKLVVQTVPNPVIKVGLNVNFAMLRHAMFKMAYEFAYMWLGEVYLDDPRAAELRNAIMSATPNSTDALGGYVGWAEPCTAFSMWTPHQAHHLAYSMDLQNSIALSVRVFDIWAISTLVTDKAIDYLGSPPNSDITRFIAMDATTSKQVETSFFDERMRMAHEMTRLGRTPPFPDPLPPPATA